MSICIVWFRLLSLVSMFVVVVQWFWFLFESNSSGMLGCRFILLNSLVCSVQWLVVSILWKVGEMGMFVIFICLGCMLCFSICCCVFFEVIISRLVLCCVQCRCVWQLVMMRQFRKCCLVCVCRVLYMVVGVQKLLMMILGCSLCSLFLKVFMFSQVNMWLMMFQGWFWLVSQ